MSEPTPPHAISLVDKNDEGIFKSNIDEVEQILLDPAIRDLPVAIVSVAGKYRRGKSFLLNFFLRYLNKKTHGQDLENWMGSEDENLEGFTWKVQSKRVTSGILIWSKVFVTELNNEKIAIILMDTQGTFDDEHTMNEHAKIFGMTTLLSSVEIYNVLRDIEEDDLQALAIFTKYAEQIHDSSDFKMGQKLQILVRDWSYPHEFPYGTEGGKVNLAQKLSTENRKPEFVRVRKALKSSFENITCYLMPNPGTEIVTNPNSNGKLSAMDKTFAEYLKKYVPFVLSEEVLTVKKFNGKVVTVSDFVHYVKNYEKILTQGSDSDSMNIFEIHIRATFDLARKNALYFYSKKMKEQNCETLEECDQFHNQFHEAAIGIYRETKMRGSEDIQQKIESELENEITISYQILKSDVLSQILEKARTTFESARKNALDLYLENMKKNQSETLEEFDYLHNQSYEAAMKLVADINISGAEHIQENIESNLKNELSLLCQSLKSDVSLRILEKTRKTFESARRNAVDLYLENMKRIQFETLESFEQCHNQHYKTAMSLIKDINLSGADDIQEMHESTLKNEITILYQSLKSDISAQILEKNRKTLESARKNAVDLYSKTMKAKQIGTIEEFDYLHNQSLEAAMKQFNEIKISNAEDIQENIESKLKNEISILYQSLRSEAMSQILEKARKTFESALKNAVDSYLKNMRGKQFKTLEEFDLSHIKSLEAAVGLVNEIKISGAEHIQENIESKLKYEITVLYQSLKSDVSSQIVEKARQAFDAAQKDAVDLYSTNMKKNTYQSLDLLDQCHNHYFEAAMDLFNELKTSGAEDIQAKYKSKLKNEISILYQSMKSDVTQNVLQNSKQAYKSAQINAFKLYYNEMMKKTFDDLDKLEEFHNHYYRIAMQLFGETEITGAEDIEVLYGQQLNNEITNLYQSLKSNISQTNSKKSKKSLKSARRNAFDLYSDKMMSTSFDSLEKLDEFHNHYYRAAMDLFRDTEVTGSDDVKDKYENDLKNDILFLYQSRKNDIKLKTVEKTHEKEMKQMSDKISKESKKKEKEEKKDEKEDKDDLLDTAYKKIRDWFNF